MKILFVGAGQSPHMHGWEAFFARAGHEVHLLTWHMPDVQSSEVETGVNVHYLPAQKLLARPGLGLVRSAWASLCIRYLTRRHHIELVHAHQVIPYGFWGALSGRKPLIVTAWGSDLLTEPHASRRAMRYIRFTLSHADLLTADSEYLRQAAVSLGLKAPSLVVQLGVDIEQFKPLPKSASRRAVGLRPDVPVVLSPRALSAVYNIDAVIDSIPLVLKRVPSACFIFKYGYAGGREEALKEHAERLRVLDHVRFVGFTEVTEMPIYYAASDVCVSVASSDSSPKSVLEAMACGTPVVLSDLPWVHEHITDGQQALLVKPRDTVGLAEAVVRLLTDAELSTRIGAAGRAMVMRYANYQQSMSYMNEIYNAIAAGKSPELFD